jgi:alkylation response protein AidB-like acyl-CoA dehydrogenase
VRLSYSEAEQEFAHELRSWLAAAVPALGPQPMGEDWEARRRFDTDWQRQLFDAGYAGMSWPKEYGGRNATPGEQLVFLEECNRAGAPYVGVNFVGNMHAGPTIMAEGTEEQKQRFLPPILRGDEVWCQGFSEPNAGSDLAGLRTRAVRDGDEYVVTGQKLWSSFAHVAEVGELLVRTDPDAPKHRGISWLVVPMHVPGITIRPIKTVAGSSEFCEVFYDEARIPVANRVGKENDGWRVTMVTLAFERGTGFFVEIMEGVRLARQLVTVAGAITRGSATAWDDVALRREVGRLAADFDALWSLTAWNVSEASRDGVPGPGGSLLKLRLCEAFQELAELGMKVLGRAGLAREDIAGLGTGHLVEEYLRTLALTIGGGTSQVQRNIVAERVLGLPKEPPWTSN